MLVGRLICAIMVAAIMSAFVLVVFDSPIYALAMYSLGGSVILITLSLTQWLLSLLTDRRAASLFSPKPIEEPRTENE